MMTDETTIEETKTDEAKTKRVPIPAAVLEHIYEEWVAHPDRVQYVPLKDHHVLAREAGWWFSGRYGFGEAFEALPEDLLERLAVRDADVRR